MNVLEHKKRGGAEAVINKEKVRLWAEQWGVDVKSGPPVDPEAFVERVGSRSASVED
jgi:histone acetyltransferase HTATIP